MITALSVNMGQTYYCKYEPEGEIVHAVIAATGSVGDLVSVSLIRRTLGADLELASQVRAVTGSPLHVLVEFDLTALKDADGFSTARCSTRVGDYRIVATAGNVTARAAFTVVPVSLAKMRAGSLFGIPLTSSTMFEPGTTTPLAMSDDEIMDDVLTAMAELSAALHIELEPTLVVTDRLATTLAYDKIGPSLALYPPTDGRWTTVQIPFHPRLKVNVLSSYYNQDPIMIYGPEWRVDSQGGIVTLMPSGGAAWQPGPSFGFGLGMYGGGRSYIPNFWEYSILVGLREIPTELLHLIEKRAALDILSKVSAVYYPGGITPGTTSHSISRDGVTETNSHNAQGIFGSRIAQLRQELEIGDDGTDNEIAKLRVRYGGVRLVVI